MLASSTGNNPPAAPTASQRSPTVMTSPRYIGSRKLTRTSFEAMGPAGPTLSRPATPPSQAACDIWASQVPCSKFSNRACAAREPTPTVRS